MIMIFEEIAMNYHSVLSWLYYVPSRLSCLRALKLDNDETWHSYTLPKED